MRKVVIDKNSGTMYGDYIEISDKIDLSNPSDNDLLTIKKGKELMVEQICNAIKYLAERDDFIIVKESVYGISFSWKIICPTVKDETDEAEL